MSDIVSKITREKELRCDLSHPSVKSEMPVLTSIVSHLTKEEIKMQLTNKALQNKGGWKKEENFDRYMTVGTEYEGKKREKRSNYRIDKV